jgi:hypothetical protein
MLAQEVGGFPLDTKVVGTAGGLLAFFAYLMFRGMGRAERRVDNAAESVVAAAAAERDRALIDEQRAMDRWEASETARMEQQAEFLRNLDAKNREMAELRVENQLLRDQLGQGPRQGPKGPTRR